MYSYNKEPPKKNSVGNSLGPSVSLQVTWPGIDDAGDSIRFAGMLLRADIGL